MFHINPNEQVLVMTLCHGSACNNLEAVKCWIDGELADENKDEKVEYWEGQLSKVLNELTGYGYS